MRLPSFTPMNQPPQQEAKFLPIEEDIRLAQEQIDEAQRKYDETKGVVEKINLEEAKMRLEFLQEGAGTSAANEPEIRKSTEVLGRQTGELQEIQTKIAAAERGIDLANNLNDMERLGQMMARLQELREEEQNIKHKMNEEAANTSAFDQATSREQISKQDRKAA